MKTLTQTCRNLVLGGFWHIQLLRPDQEHELSVRAQVCSGLFDRLQDLIKPGVAEGLWQQQGKFSEQEKSVLESLQVLHGVDG